jgi:hypothetical protein
MKKTHDKLGLILALTLGASVTANGSVLYNNIPASTQYLDGLVLHDFGFFASQFSTNSSVCAPGCTLGNITLNLFSDSLHNPSGNTNGYQLQVFSDVGNAPGMALISMNNPAVFNSVAANHVFTPNGILNLNSSTNYWVKLSADSGNGGGESVTWSIYQNAIQTQAGQPTLFQYSDSVGSFYTFTNPKLLMSVEATANAVVPVPGAAWLMGSALLGLVASWRRKTGR